MGRWEGMNTKRKKIELPAEGEGGGVLYYILYI